VTYRVHRRLLGLITAAILVELMAFNSLLVWLYLVAAMLLAAVVLGLIGPHVALRRGQLVLLSWHRQSGAEFQPPLPSDARRLFAGDCLVLHLGGRIEVERLTSGSLRLVDNQTLEISAFKRTSEGLEMTTASLKRGPLQIVGLDLTSSWPTAVASATVQIPIQQSLVVCPPYAVLKSRAGTITPELETVVARRGSGEEFLGLREYQTGDTRRRIHWRTTARSGQLMVVETALQTDKSVEVLVGLEDDATEQASDLAASVAATLVAQAVQEGLPFVLYIGSGSGITSWSGALTGLGLAEPATRPKARATVSAHGSSVLISQSERNLEVSADTSLAAVCGLLQ
jgi:uncharacterized protein (DUF58 family)